jgi:hypothetical protein
VVVGVPHHVGEHDRRGERADLRRGLNLDVQMRRRRSACCRRLALLRRWRRNVMPTKPQNERGWK